MGVDPIGDLEHGWPGGSVRRIERSCRPQHRRTKKELFPAGGWEVVVKSNSQTKQQKL